MEQKVSNELITDDEGELTAEDIAEARVRALADYKMMGLLIIAIVLFFCIGIKFNSAFAGFVDGICVWIVWEAVKIALVGADAEYDNNFYCRPAVDADDITVGITIHVD